MTHLASSCAQRGFWALLGLLLVVTVGCEGQIGEAGPGAPPSPSLGPSGPDGGPSAQALTAPSALGPVAVRRLSRQEIRLSVMDLLGLDPEDAVDLLPVDAETPFDNDVATQYPSAALVTGLNAFAEQISATFEESPRLHEAVLGCTPAGPSDEACLRSFIAHFGRRVVRRPLRDEEIDELAEFRQFAEATGNFSTAVRLVIHTLLQDVEFVYRIETGEPVADAPNLRRLNDFEVASRLSFLLWGRIPDDALLDRAASGDLETADGVVAEASRLLEDPRGAEQLSRIHAMWLNYDETIDAGSFGAELGRETAAMLRRIVYEEQRPWLDVFTFGETFVSDELAEHYGLDKPLGAPAWVPYDSGRAGLLSQGSFLSTGSRFGDTSPTQRGKNILERLLCREIPKPPATVNLDDPPEFGGPNACKPEVYAMDHTQGCESCHGFIDPIGWGLENYGQLGEYREHELDRPDCIISGEGSVAGLGDFHGPAELGELLAASGEVEACFAEHLYRYALGREPGSADIEAKDAVVGLFEGRSDVLALLTEFVSSEAFRYRVIEE